MIKFSLLAIMLLFMQHTTSAQSNKILSAAEMQQDLAILESSWSNLHPGLYRYNTPAEIKGYFAGLRNTCNVSMDERKFYLLVSRLAEKIKCGHTYLNPLNLDSLTKSRLLPKQIIPLFFEIVDKKKIIITHNLSNNKLLQPGDEIRSINGIPASTIIDSLLTVSRSDGRNALGKKLNNINESPDEATAFSLFDIYFPLFFNSIPGNFSITTDRSAGMQLPLALISYEDRITRFEQQFGKIPTAEKTWDYKILTPTTAYMKFGTFAFWNSKFKPMKYVDSVFNDLLQKKGISNLIIDIRNNEGGDNTGSYILSYITQKKIGCDDPDRPCYRYLTIPDSLLKHLSTWDKSFKKPKDPSKFQLNELGLYELRKDAHSCNEIEPKENGFRGKIFLLTNAKNSSAGYEMARNFHTAGIGKIVGETTGGSQQGINGGEFFFLTLPNSKFEIDLPLIYNYHASKPDKGISPDHEVKTTQKDIRLNKDAQLAFVLSLINK